MCSGSVVVTPYDFESGRLGSNPEWGPIYYKASIPAQGLPKPSSFWDSTLGTRAAEHNWGMQIDWWLQPRAVFGHTFSGIIWNMPQKQSQFNCMTLLWWRHHEIATVTLHTYIYIACFFLVCIPLLKCNRWQCHQTRLLLFNNIYLTSPHGSYLWYQNQDGLNIVWIWSHQIGKFSPLGLNMWEVQLHKRSDIHETINPDFSEIVY